MGVVVDNMLNSIGLNSKFGLYGLTGGVNTIEGSDGFELLLNSIGNIKPQQKSILSLESFSIGGGIGGMLEAISAATSGNTISTPFDDIIGRSGPLPTYLREVVAQRKLNPQKTYALYEIAARNMDIVKSPESVMKLAQELDAAGI